MREHAIRRVYVGQCPVCVRQERAMVKMVLLVGFLSLVAVFVSGQTANTQQRVPRIVTADQIAHKDNTFEARESVRIEIGTVVITADEADAKTTGSSTDPIDFDLRGNGHAQTTPSK